ncbi:MAG: SlyX family protein [Gammaproteobacteria bacterium]|nr:SlyX family protein [Gammaproteobacteria bacterium]
MEARLTDLEGRYAFLDDLLQHLESVVTSQQRAIDDLRDQLEQTRDALKQADLSGGSSQNDEPPPPHY